MNLAEDLVPRMRIIWVEGRSLEQKRAIAERITTVWIEDGKAKKEHIHVAFHDVLATNYAEAGVLVIDQKRTPRDGGRKRKITQRRSVHRDSQRIRQGGFLSPFIRGTD